MRWLLLFSLAIAPPLCGQSSSTFLDPSRAINWNANSGAGFTIPAYSVNCATQPTVTAGSGNTATNGASIRAALNSCDATHNVVNIPAGTYYADQVSFGTQGHQVLRGAGPNSTKLILTSGVGGTGGLTNGILMRDATGYYNGSGATQPGGSNACAWTAGYAQGTTSITLNSCAGGLSAMNALVNKTIILDQANDVTDTNGVYICDTNIANCGYEGSTGGNNDGRFIGGKTYSQQQVTKVTAVSGSGTGPYTVTISPGVYFTNIRSGQSPGAWWPGTVQNDGLENITIDGSNVQSTIGMYDCYQCWVKNVVSLNGGRNHVNLYQSFQDTIQDSYFYQSQSHSSQSYGIETSEESGLLVVNNIFEQITNPTMFGQGSGTVVAYNLGIGNIYTGATNWMAGTYSVHNGGSGHNLFEGNVVNGLWADDAWGSSDLATYFRNNAIGWQTTLVNSTFAVMIRAYDRAFNLVGNVFGQPGYHTQYQTYANSTSGGIGAGAENASIYTLGWGGTGPVCASGSVTTCDPYVFNTLMRWGNYDTVTAGVRWDATEASPGAVTYLNANFTSSYFGTLAHTLPASLYYSSTPSWWPSGKAWPAIGPDVSTGNVGTCSGGTYAGSQATASGQCPGGTLVVAWASHVTSIPALDCYLSLGGHPDGTGAALAFDATPCYAAAGSSNRAHQVTVIMLQ